MQKRVLTIQDYSTMGRCSLTVALPIISSLKIECVGLPTAILSNHTAFPSFEFVDLTSKIIPFVDKWNDFNNHFDTIYTGYLAKGQVDIIIKIIERLKESNTNVVIDPAFADGGNLYKGFDLEHVNDMKRLIPFSDYLLPNLSEACFLTDTKYTPDDDKVIDEVTNKLFNLGAKNILLSGISKDNKKGCLFFNKNEKFFYGSENLHTKFHGTGDVFASAFTGLLTAGKDDKTAVKIAHDFTTVAMKKTIEDKVDGVLYGPEFEKALYILNDSLVKE